jgi:nucleoside-diphosphate kinase
MTDPIERTLVLLKPESVERGICGEIITRFERMGLKIVGLKMVKPALETCKQHYPFTEEWALSAGKKALDNLKERGIVTDKT